MPFPYEFFQFFVLFSRCCSNVWHFFQILFRFLSFFPDFAQIFVIFSRFCSDFLSIFPYVVQISDIFLSFCLFLLTFVHFFVFFYQIFSKCVLTFFQILSYTRGTKALIRNATASDYYEGTSVSNTESRNADKKPSNREAEKRVTTVFIF